VFDGAGPDGIWATADDDLLERQQSEGTGCGVTCDVLIR
jgi:hypothetical protein